MEIASRVLCARKDQTGMFPGMGALELLYGCACDTEQHSCPYKGVACPGHMRLGMIDKRRAVQACLLDCVCGDHPLVLSYPAGEDVHNVLSVIRPFYNLEGNKLIGLVSTGCCGLSELYYPYMNEEYDITDPAFKGILGFGVIDFIRLNLSGPRSSYYDDQAVNVEKALSRLLLFDTEFVQCNVRNKPKEHRGFDIETVVHQWLSADDLRQMKQDWLMSDRRLQDNWYLRPCNAEERESAGVADDYTPEELADMAIAVGAHVRGIPQQLIQKVETKLKEVHNETGDN